MVGLAVDTEVHDVVTADGAVVDDNVPRPKSDSIPLHECVSNPAHQVSRLCPGYPYLLDLKLLLSLGDIAACTNFGVLVDFGRSARIGHLDVGHGGCGVLGAWFVERRVARVVMEATGRV